jgi:hypothetical protein
MAVNTCGSECGMSTMKGMLDIWNVLDVRRNMMVIGKNVMSV